MRDEAIAEEELLDAEAIDANGAEVAGDEVAAEPVRPLPDRCSDPGEIEPWKGEVRTVAIAAAGGLAVGVATVAAVRVVRGASRRQPKRPVRRAKERSVVASRSFLVDVHLLGR